MQGRHNNFEGGGYNTAREKSSDPPCLAYLGDIKQNITVFITAIMMYKRLCLPASNDYNSGLCDYHMAMAMARLKL